MHSYINKKLVKDFTKKITIDTVVDDLLDTYKVTNILDDDNESLAILSDALYQDYIRGRSNYRSYLEVGMDARIMMELRKSAVYFMDSSLDYFYEGHRYCETVSDIKSYRIKVFSEFCYDYRDLNWQYHYLTAHCLRGLSKDFFFDYESCFADGDYRKETGIEDYERDFFNAHMPPRLWK